MPTVKANFLFNGFEIELFGQPQSTTRQYAYLHMVIEAQLMHQNPGIKEKVISLKKQGYKTEPAFCKVLGLEGDPYRRLLDFGMKHGII